MRYEKKPPVVDAEQYLDEGLPHTHEANIDADGSPKYKFDDTLQKWKVKTAEGWMWLKVGDWILLNEADRKYYLRSDNDFKLNYRVCE